VRVNFFYAHNVGHAVEALHYGLGHYLADPSREICVALNAERRDAGRDHRLLPVRVADVCHRSSAAGPLSGFGRATVRDPSSVGLGAR
jgi:hypothetical protein